MHDSKSSGSLVALSPEPRVYPHSLAAASHKGEGCESGPATMLSMKSLEFLVHLKCN